MSTGWSCRYRIGNNNLSLSSSSDPGRRAILWGGFQGANNFKGGLLPSQIEALIGCDAGGLGPKDAD